MFGLSKVNEVNRRIEALETAMLESIQTAEDFGIDGDREGQMVCMTSATAYGTAALVLRAKRAAGELEGIE